MIRYKCSDNSIWPSLLLATDYATEYGYITPVEIDLSEEQIIQGYEFWRCQYVWFLKEGFVGVPNRIDHHKTTHASLWAERIKHTFPDRKP